MQILNTQSQYSYTIWGKVDWDAWTITRDRGLFYNVKCHYINLQLWCNCIILNANLSHHNNPEYLWIYNKIVYLLLLFSHQIMPDSSQPHHDPFESLTAARQASLLHTISQSLHKFTSTESVMPSSHLTLGRPLLLLPSIFPSRRVFSSESVLLIKWPNCWSSSFRISTSNEYAELTSFKIDWFDLLDQTQETLKSLLQHHSSEASVLRCSAFFTVWLSQPHMTTGKTIQSLDYPDLCWQSDSFAF